MPRRFKTNYPGVFYREADRIGARDKEKVFYIVFKKDGKVLEEKVGRQYADNMTPARASGIRGERIRGKIRSRKEIRKEREEQQQAERNKWTIGKLWAEYCESHTENKVLRAESLKFDRYIRPLFGYKEPSELVALDIDRLRIRLQRQGKQTTAARILEILRRTVNFGVKRGLVSPISFKIEVPKLNNETTEDISEEQVARLISVLNQDPDRKAANIMRLALLSGMRRSEILQLKWEDLDFRRGFIRLVNSKSGRDEIIPLNDAVRAVLDEIEPKIGNPYIFPGKLPGTHLTECRRSFNRIRKAAGLPEGFRPLHGLRHTYASMLASSGQVDLYTLQKLLTHKSPQMTQRYSHLRDDALKKASNLAGSIIEQAINNGNKTIIRFTKK
ncbi:MAG: tyrosine-type recombinase/integrase [Syntrophobacteraceae bacterium]